MTFKGSGAHVRIELSLKSHHDLEGSGGVRKSMLFRLFS